jgi:phosphate:Na+ symporter
MEFTFAVATLAGAIALLLWGTHMVQTGVQRAFGVKLRTVLGRTLRHRRAAFLAGIGVTALLQSSTATGLMATGFTAGGFVDLVPALAIMLGANVGTALIVGVLSFDVYLAAPIVILIGFLMFRRSRAPVVHDLGRVLIGLGLMLMALHQMLEVLQPAENSNQLRLLLSVIAAIPPLDLLIGLAAAWAAHSSVAVVLLIISLASGHVLPLDAAFYMVLGANIGTAINPLLEGNTGTNPAARRLPMGNLLNRVVGAIVALAIVEPLAAAVSGFGVGEGQAVALFHVLFNLVLALILLPLLNPVSRFLGRLLPDLAAATDPGRPLYLDTSARETPIVALGAAAREALRLADTLERMLRDARDALLKGDRRLIADIRNRDDILDNLNSAIKRYLTAFDPDDLSGDDKRRLDEILAFSMNMEQAGDIIDRNLLPHATKRVKRGVAISHEGEKELMEMMARLIANVRTAASLLMTEDERVARLLAEEKVAFRKAEHDATTEHFQRLRTGRLDVAQSSSLQLDLLRDLKMINSYVVAAAAYPVLDRTGELLPSRLAAAAD